MSVQAISWVLESSAATGATRCVLVSIANHLDPDGEGWCHVERICREANCSPDTYRRAVQWAIGAGELVREVRAGGSAKVPDIRRPNLFQFPALIAASRPLQSAGVEADPDPCNLRGSDPRDLLGSSPLQSAGDGSRAVSEPSSEPSPRAPGSSALVASEPVPFDVFWASYPRKVGKPTAQKSFKAAAKKAPLEALLAGLERWKAHWDDPGFIPHPSTWLNQERWNDDPGPPRARGRSAPGESMRQAMDAYVDSGVAPGSLLPPAEPYCAACDLDAHRCAGCGATVKHGSTGCDECLGLAR